MARLGVRIRTLRKLNRYPRDRLSETIERTVETPGAIERGNAEAGDQDGKGAPSCGFAEPGAPIPALF